MVKISVSLLSMRDNLKEKIEKLNDSDIDYIHLDIMDNKFVPYKSYTYDEIKTIVSRINKPLMFI
jgi:ribulose-phosphate 3-epimerase